MAPAEAKHIHLIGVCGTAMASLAGLLKQHGHRVTGSDAGIYPPMSDLLRSLGVPIAQPYDENNLSPRPDLVVVGNAISRGNPELEYVLDERIPFKSLPAVLHEEFLAGKQTLAVAGTHGKTTTTSMLAWILQSAGLNPSFLIGGVAENFGTSFALRQSEHFVIEADEYDSAFFDKGPKFMHYFPDALILTSVEFDHADIYQDLAAVKTAFKRLANLVPRRGVIVAFDGNVNVEECVSRAFCKVERYGFHPNSEWRVSNIVYETTRTSWRLWRGGKELGALEFPLAGEYNVLNATAAVAMAMSQGVSFAAAQEALGRFQSVKRRLEVKAQVRGVTVIDDFAHHPTAIAETLKALRTRYPEAKLWAVCEPRSNTLRRKVFEAELADSLSVADEVIVASVYRPEAVSEGERLSVERVIARVNALGKRGRELKDADAITTAIAADAREGDVVAILSNGGFGGIYEKLPRALAGIAP